MTEEAPKKPGHLILIFMPLIFLGSILVTLALPDFIADSYLDWGVPFLFSFWVGMGFTFAWDYIRYQMHVERFSSGMTAGVGLLGALILLLMIGVDTLWSDPWLIGVAVWPGIVLARPWLERWAAARSDGGPGQS